MNNKTDELLETLLKEVKDKASLDQLNDELFKRGVQALLKAEMEAHLGYPKGSKPKGSNQRNGYSQKTLKTSKGDIPINIPRDREASFDPVTIPKHKTMGQEIEDIMISLYAKGMSNADIIDFIESTYGVAYSTSQVSIITNSLLEDIKAWQTRPLDDIYPIVWIDAIYYKIRQDGTVKSRAAMIVLGVNIEGKQDILSIHIMESESAAGWMEMLTDLKSRGVKDIFFLCSDNLKGLEKAIESVYPSSIRQICIVHQIRNSLRMVSYKDRKAIMKDIKAIYKADNLDMAQQAMEEFSDRWSSKYGKAVASWKENWDNLTAFLSYPHEIRKLIYTTNIIESFNASLRKYTKNKKSFPNDNAALKSIYLAAMAVRKKWEKSRFGWGQIYNQLYIHFEDRIS
jgi:transposase-like protein